MLDVAIAEQVYQYLEPSQVRSGALSDLLSSLGRGLDVAAARSYLSRLQGSGKAAALAKSLVGSGQPGVIHHNI